MWCSQNPWKLLGTCRVKYETFETSRTRTDCTKTNGRGIENAASKVSLKNSDANGELGPISESGLFSDRNEGRPYIHVFTGFLFLYLCLAVRKLVCVNSFFTAVDGSAVFHPSVLPPHLSVAIGSSPTRQLRTILHRGIA